MTDAAPKRIGRPPAPPGIGQTEMIRVRCTPAQRAKFDTLGGADWLRGKIDKAKLPHPAERNPAPAEKER